MLHQAQDARLWWHERPYGCMWYACMSASWHKHCPNRQHRTLCNRASCSPGCVPWCLASCTCWPMFAQHQSCSEKLKPAHVKHYSVWEHIYMQHSQVHLLITLLTCVLRSSVLDNWRRSITSRLTLTGTHADVAEAIFAKQKLPVRSECQTDH